MLDEKQYHKLCARGHWGLALAASVAAVQQNLLKRGHTHLINDNVLTKTVLAVFLSVLSVQQNNFDLCANYITKRP